MVILIKRVMKHVCFVLHSPNALVLFKRGFSVRILNFVSLLLSRDVTL